MALTRDRLLPHVHARVEAKIARGTKVTDTFWAGYPNRLYRFRVYWHMEEWRSSVDSYSVVSGEKRNYVGVKTEEDCPILSAHGVVDSVVQYIRPTSKDVGGLMADWKTMRAVLGDNWEVQDLIFRSTALFLVSRTSPDLQHNIGPKERGTIRLAIDVLLGASNVDMETALMVALVGHALVGFLPVTVGVEGEDQGRKLLLGVSNHLAYIFRQLDGRPTAV